MKIRDTSSDAPPTLVVVIDPLRGVLYPERLPEFHRLAPPSSARGLVAWFWIPEWELGEGRSSRQHIVGYPALNLVVDAEGVGLYGASTRAGHRDLTGSGWAVGALLRPAAVPALTDSAAELRDRAASFVAPDLHAAVVAAMTGGGAGHREQAAAAFADWLAARVGPLTSASRQANTMADLLMTDASVLTAEDAAGRLAVSLRTLQRMAHRYVGVPPLAMIRRRRLQEAAQRLREHPETDLATLAAELGYADHAHLSHDFRTVLGLAPSRYRTAVAADD